MSKKVTFILSAEVVGNATSGLLLGEFNNWNYNEGIELTKQKDGSMKATASLKAGSRYEYRYLLNDGRWVNDQSADQYIHISGLQVENCVINVSEEKEEIKKTAVKVKAAAPSPEKEISAEKVKNTPKKTAASKEKSVSEKVIKPTESTPKAKTVKAKTPKS